MPTVLDKILGKEPKKNIFELTPKEIEQRKLERFKKYFSWANYLDSIDKIINEAEKQGSEELKKRARETKKAVERDYDLEFLRTSPKEIQNILKEYPGMFLSEIMDTLKGISSGGERYDNGRGERLDAANKALMLENFVKENYDKYQERLKEKETKKQEKAFRESQLKAIEGQNKRERSKLENEEEFYLRHLKQKKEGEERAALESLFEKETEALKRRLDPLYGLEKDSKTNLEEIKKIEKEGGNAYSLRVRQQEIERKIKEIKDSQATQQRQREQEERRRNRENRRNEVVEQPIVEERQASREQPLRGEVVQTPRTTQSEQESEEERNMPNIIPDWETLASEDERNTFLTLGQNVPGRTIQEKINYLKRKTFPDEEEESLLQNLESFKEEIIAKGIREGLVQDEANEEKPTQERVQELSSIPGGRSRANEETTRRTYVTPHEEEKGDVYNTQEEKQVDPERIKLLGIQEAAKRIANQPFEENPYAKAAELDPLIEEGINIQNELERETRERPNEFKFPESTRKEAIERFINPEYSRASLEARMAMRRYLDPEMQNTMAITLKDKIMEDVRRKAVKRLEDSYRDMGLRLSAQRIGRNTFEDVQKRKMFENMNNELNALDNETLMKLLLQQKQQSKEEVEQTTRAHELERAHQLNASQVAMKADEEERLRALEAYKVNKIMEDARREERRKAAASKISAGQLKTIQEQEKINRASEEFTRRQNFPKEQIGSYLNTLTKATLGNTPYTLPERVQQHAPSLVPELAPQRVEREIPGDLQPVVEIKQPDTTLRDTMGMATGLGSLALEAYKAFRPEKTTVEAGGRVT